MCEWFIDRSGRVPLFLHEGRFISEDGITVGWLYDDCVYSLDGAHVGWLERGVLYDENNDIVALSVNAPGHVSHCSHGILAPPFPIISEAPPMPNLFEANWRPLHGGRSNKRLRELFGAPDEDGSRAS